MKDLERNLTGYQEKRDNMNVLEKILEEIEDVRKIMKSTVATNCFGKECENDDCTVCVCERVIEIIRSHMNDGNDIIFSDKDVRVSTKERMLSLFS